MTKHLVIPDTQIEPGSNLNHLFALSNYIVHKRPDVIIQLGDFVEMKSLSSYDNGKKANEGARYQLDIEAGKIGMQALMSSIEAFNAKARRLKIKQYKPKQILTLGNHENRIARHVNTYPILEGKLSYRDLDYESYGWEVFPFLKCVEQDGILYSHYFPRNDQGRVAQTRRGAPSAALQVRREMQSCTAGHLQGLDFAIQQTGTRRYYGLIAGSFYMHDPEYLSPQGEAYWRGIIVKNQVRNGEYDPMFVSLEYLLGKWL